MYCILMIQLKMNLNMCLKYDVLLICKLAASDTNKLFVFPPN